MLTTTNISYQYKNGPQFNFPDLSCPAGDILLVLGKSGIGKSTLLNILGGLMKINQGEIIIDGSEVSKLSPSKMDAFRGSKIGIIFQKHHFISSLTVIENLMLAQELSGGKKNRSACLDLLKSLDIEEKQNSKIRNLSEGEKQRVSIARAVINNPKVILADEPTSALDDDNCHKVVELLQHQAQKVGAALVVVTHDKRLKDIIHNQVVLS